MLAPLAVLSLYDGADGAEDTPGIKGLREDWFDQMPVLRHRFVTQGIGVLAIFFTAMYGMYVNLYVGPFGGFLRL